MHIIRNNLVFLIILSLSFFFNVQSISAQYCDENVTCPSGRICNQSTNSCVNPPPNNPGGCVESGICAPGHTCNQTTGVCEVIIPPADCTPGMGINLSDCLKLSDDSLVRDRYSSAGFLVNLIVKNLFVIAGIILFFLILLAGYKFIIGGKKGVEEARTLITTALTGFAIMFAAYWIVQIMKVITGTDIPL